MGDVANATSLPAPVFDISVQDEKRLALFLGGAGGQQKC
jgi:hypothetical protein